MSQTLVTLALPPGSNVPTQVHLPDATTVFPDSAGKIQVPAAYVVPLMGAGWQMQVTSGTTHVP